jgi:hypothetical protein
VTIAAGIAQKFRSIFGVNPGYTFGFAMIFAVAAYAPVVVAGEPATNAIDSGDAQRVDTQLTGEMENIKKELLELRRDLVVLEEDLLFPASSQVAVFVSVDVGEFFQLDAVTLTINDKEVTHHLYTEKQVDALFRGGVQKLYVGNVKQGKNTVTAYFTGRGPAGRDYRRASTVTFEKTFEPAFVELKVTDSTSKYQPEFEAAAGH